jgi:diguanylate cyclase (GGDEF)-like protein
MRSANTSLLRIFIIPFLILMLSLAAMISWVLYRSGENVTDAFAQKNLEEFSYRIQGAVERHLSSAQVILDTVAPESIVTADKQFHIPLDLPRELSQIESRLWIATGLFPTINNLAYFAGEDGSFISVKRILPEALVELRYTQAGEKQSNVYSMAGPQQRIALLRSDQFEPKNRPWYINAIGQGKSSWSSVYIDFTYQIPLLTLSKPVFKHTSVTLGKKAELIGVVATDLSLKQLSTFLQKMPIPTNGVAYIVQHSGELVATSLSEIPYVRINETSVMRQAASDSANAAMRVSAKYVQQNMMQMLMPGKPVLTVIKDENHQAMQLAVTLLKDDAGLDWISIVAIPRAALRVETINITTNSLIFCLVIILIMAGLGYAILRWTIDDIVKLAKAASSMGHGEPFKEIDIHRQDEIGTLAHSLQDMEKQLRVDGLTQLLNRDTFMSHIDFKRRRATDKQDQQFTLLFIDLDNFKEINDTFGHEAGDKILIEASKRMTSTIRKEDSAARFGGDEFVIYLHGVQDINFIEQLCDKLHERLEAPMDIGGGTTCRVGASIGIAIHPADGNELDNLLRIADERMFEDKKRRKAEADSH